MNVQTPNALAVLACAAAAASADIIQVSYGSLTGDYVETFETFDAGAPFVGAPTTTASSPTPSASRSPNASTASPSPTAPTRAAAAPTMSSAARPTARSRSPSAATQNLVIGDTTPVGGTGHAISGLSSPGWPNFQAIGEGAATFLFDVGQPDVGFTTFGALDGGDLRADFYDRGGGLLGSVTIDEIRDGGFGFATSDGSASIAGMVITNTEAEGISYDNVWYHTVPTPGSLAVLACGGAAAIRRRR
ncbi:MAG: hypothetical protein HND58_08905 [Planctomycetota bacterium]|nr:MAG: hypothetical protein HND58_08905 [Planctomycetota bacterium]